MPVVNINVIIIIISKSTLHGTVVFKGSQRLVDSVEKNVTFDLQRHSYIHHFC